MKTQYGINAITGGAVARLGARALALGTADAEVAGDAVVCEQPT